MKHLKKYKIFENLSVEDLLSKESKNIEDIFFDLSMIMTDWEDQGIETEYKLITDPRDSITYRVAEYNNGIEFITYISSSREENVIESLEKSGYWYSLSFGFDIYKIAKIIKNFDSITDSLTDIDFNDPGIMKYSTKLKECYDEVYNRILTVFNPKDTYREVFNALEGKWYKIHDKSWMINNYKLHFKYEITFKI
jgi:hypothetical protein